MSITKLFFIKSILVFLLQFMTTKSFCQALAGEVKTNDLRFFADSVFHGYKSILKYYFSKYTDSCPVNIENKFDALNDFEGIKPIGHIRTGKTKKDSVFILNPLTTCKYATEDVYDGQAYYFTDTTLPRLQTDSYCCHPTNIFLVGDIDEDGISEIGLYLSSCAGHYKSLKVYKLKGKSWREIGSCVYDSQYANSNGNFSTYIKKIRKNEFEMFEQTDLPRDSTKSGKPYWIKFRLTEYQIPGSGLSKVL